MKRFFIFLLGLITNTTMLAQNYPIYSQYFSDPFLYNVGAIGLNDYMQLNLNYRQQWVGVEDAPVTSTFNLQIPTKGNVSYAISGYSEKAVFLRNSVALATFGYRVPFSEGHFISFGLSAGMGVSDIDVEGLDVNDPAVLNAYSSSYSLDGQFGAYYKFKHLSVGASLPKLFGTKTVSTDQFQEFKFSALEDIIYTMSYEFNIPNSMLSLTPYALYRSGNTSQQQIEATAIIDYKKMVYLGGSYRLDYGASFFFGLSFNGLVDLGYGYEMASKQTAQLGDGTHEFQIKIRLGKKKRTAIVRSEKPTPEESGSESIPQTEPTNNIEEQVEEVKDPIETIVPVVVPAKDTLVQKSPIKQIEEVEEEDLAPKDTVSFSKNTLDEFATDSEEPKSNEPGKLSSGIYVIVGVFKIEKNATNYSTKINSKGLDSHVGIYKDGLYYVYAYQSKNKQEAKQIRIQISKDEKYGFEGAWILEIE